MHANMNICTQTDDVENFLAQIYPDILTIHDTVNLCRNLNVVYVKNLIKHCNHSLMKKIEVNV